MAIVPMQTKDFDILEFGYIRNVLRSMNLKEPKQGESYWRVPSYLTISDVEIMIEKIKETHFNTNDIRTFRRDALEELPVISENLIENPMEVIEKVEEIRYGKYSDFENKENEIEWE